MSIETSIYITLCFVVKHCEMYLIRIRWPQNQPNYNGSTLWSRNLLILKTVIWHIPSIYMVLQNTSKNSNELSWNLMKKHGLTMIPYPKKNSARSILLSQIKNCVSSDIFKKGLLHGVRYLDHMQVNELAESKCHKRLMTSCYVTQWHRLDTLHLTSSQKADSPEKTIVSSRLSINMISWRESTSKNI